MIRHTATAATVVDLIRLNAKQDDGSEFLRLIVPGDADRVLSYRDLVRDAERWTQIYRAAGLARGDRIIVVLPHSLDLYAAYIGALLGGQVPAMFAFPSAKLSDDVYFATIGELIRGSRARLMVTYPELRAKLKAREAAAIRELTVLSSEDAAAADVPVEPVAVDPGDTAILQYSSGTTGIKKGVALSHRALLWQVANYAGAIGASKRDRIVSWLPLYHDMGLIAALFLPLIERIPLVAMSPLDWVKRPGMWLQAVSVHRGTLSWMPNFAFNFLARSVPDAELAGIDLSSMRGLVNCSEPVLAQSHDAFLARFERVGFRRDALAASYAMAENTFAVTSGGFGQPLTVKHVDGAAFDRTSECLSCAPDAPGARAFVSSGRPLPEIQVQVLATDGTVLPDRRVGEIAVTSPCLMSEYDHNPQATAEALSQGVLRTGDLGFIAAGEVFVTGRKKDLIIIGGRNIYPQDIESAVSAVDGVIAGRCVAFGVADGTSGTERLIVLVESERTDAAADRLKTDVYAVVAERTEVVPGDIVVLPPRWLVKSSSGKIARDANRRRYLGQIEERERVRSRDVAVAPDEADLVGTVRAIVRSRLKLVPGVDLAGISDASPLISSGLIDSFALAELIVALESATGRTLPPDRLHDMASIDTIAGIAVTLTEGPAEGAPVAWQDDIPMAYGAARTSKRSPGFWTLVYRILFRIKGVHYGPGLQVMGPLFLQIDGSPRNIRLGANVTLMPHVHLKNRENGRIILHDGVKLDSMVRLVAANAATIELGENVTLGMASVVNAGADVRIGRGTMTSAHCMINASDHRMLAGTPISQQPYEHAPVLIGEDVFVGAHCYIGRGSRIGAGAVVSGGSATTSDVPPQAMVQGRAARVIKYRQRAQ